MKNFIKKMSLFTIISIVSSVAYSYETSLNQRFFGSIMSDVAKNGALCLSKDFFKKPLERSVERAQACAQRIMRFGIDPQAKLVVPVAKSILVQAARNARARALEAATDVYIEAQKRSEKYAQSAYEKAQAHAQEYANKAHQTAQAASEEIAKKADSAIDSTSETVISYTQKASDTARTSTQKAADKARAGIAKAMEFWTPKK